MESSSGDQCGAGGPGPTFYRVSQKVALRMQNLSDEN